jgi:hypothetical protein
MAPVLPGQPLMLTSGPAWGSGGYAMQTGYGGMATGYGGAPQMTGYGGY